MKKIFFGMMAIVAMVATSCQQELAFGAKGNDTATVSFAVGTPSRAYSDGLTATNLQYAVYDEAGEILNDLTVTDGTINKSATVDLQLVTGNSYTVVFWAVAAGAPYTIDFDQKTMAVDYSAVASNNEALDAFYAKHDFTVTGTQTETVELRRPFAQLNIGTNDFAKAASAGYEPMFSYVKVENIYNTLNFWTGAVSNETAVEFNYAAIPAGETFPVGGYEYLAMNYLLVAADKEPVTVEFAYTETDATAAKTRLVGSVPVQRNYRTNLYGQLLTSNTTINVVIVPEYEEPALELEALQNAALNGGTVTLTEDVVLTTPLNVLAKMTIDLNGKTITGPSVAKDAAGNKIHSIINNGKLSIINGTISSVAENGGSAIYTYGDLTLDNVTINGAPSNTATGTASYAVNVVGANAKVTVNNSTINGRGAVGVTNGAKAELNGGTYHTPAVAWGHAVYADGEGTQVVINGGTFSEGYDYAADRWGMYQIYSGNKAQVIVNGGTFENWDCANGYDLCTASEGTITIYGGTFADNPASQNGKNFVAEGYAVVENNGAYTVIPTTLKDGGVLDLGGAEYNGTIIVEGNVTIKGDTKVKTIKSTTGCTITIEDGKTLTLNNFSFGAKDNAEAVYEIKGGTVTANYGFFQHGKYELYSDFETGYMYYSYGSDITVYGTFHSQGKGDGLDYVRGKLTIANGGKSIHDKSLWVGQPASWGAMNASLVIEEGGYVQANSLSVYEGSSLTYSNDADLKYNSVTGTEYIIKK